MEAKFTVNGVPLPAGDSRVVPDTEAGFTPIKAVSCERCEGTGRVWESNGDGTGTPNAECPECDGSGQVGVTQISYAVGDLIESREGIIRRILEVRPTGYEWEYPEMPGKTFMSENSNDPFFVWWKKQGEKWPEELL